MQQLIVCAASFLLASTQLAAQDPAFRVMLNKDRFAPGDTLDMIASYSVGDRQLPPATFAVTILGPQQKVWQMRWPLMEGNCEASVIWPAQMPAGRYLLLFAIQPRFLKLFGTVIYPPNPGQLTILVNNGKTVQTGTVTPTARGQFGVNDFYVEDSVQVSFRHQNKREPGPPLVQLDAWLDSAYQPAAVSVKQVVVNLPGSEEFLPQPVSKDSLFAQGYPQLQATYPMQSKLESWPGLSPAEWYDSLYLPAAFATTPQLQLNFLNDTAVTNKTSVYDALVAHMNGAAIKYWEDEFSIPDNAGFTLRKIGTESLIKWNNKWYRLYYQGNYGDPTVLTLPPEALAGIRVFDPPFFAVPNSQLRFGIIAFFERRFPLPQPFPFYHSFWVRGYQPPLYQLVW